jgi:poly-beta-1,6-N-acetyl-D-glucosamine synthase
VHNPKGILQKIQYIEYLLAVSLKKALAATNSVHITSGAFSVYRKSFFDKYGGFDEENITEDMEMALRIQYHQYSIAIITDAFVETIAPNTFSSLLKQRRRWYTGLTLNFLKYRKLFSKQYGTMGAIVLPIVVISVLLVMLLAFLTFIELASNTFKEIVIMKSTNFYLRFLEMDWIIINLTITKTLASPLTYYFLFYLAFLIFIMIYSKRKVNAPTRLMFNLFLFIILFSPLFVIWWATSIFYTITNKKFSWR